MPNTSEEHGNFKRRVSVVWRYFDKPGRDRVRCRLCKHEQNYHRTTGNLIRHLFKKHNIDATVRGTYTNKNKSTVLQLEDKLTKRIDENSNPHPENQQSQQQKLNGKVMPNDATDFDPYKDYEFPGEGYIQLNEINYTMQGPLTAEEDSILAQIDYFREKASYYRKQKDLVTLQARKMKQELDQLTEWHES